MKVITLTAPYSWLVAAQLKRWETRSWQTSHRGLLGIHTAQGLGPVGGAKGLLELCERPYFREAMIAIGIDNPLNAPLGYLIALVDLVDCRPMVENDVQKASNLDAIIIGEQTEQERAFGYWKVGRFAWKLDNVRIVEQPIKARGWQRLWEWAGPTPAVSLVTPAVVPPQFDTTRPPTGRRPGSFA